MPAYFAGGKVLPVVAALTVAALRACDSSYAVDGAMAAVLPAIQGTIEGASAYHWESANSTADDGVSVIKPNGIGGGSPGRWIASNANAPHVRGTQNAVGTATNITSIHARNTTLATVGAPQYSPAVTLSGSAWNTVGPTAVQSDWSLQNQPASQSGVYSRLTFAHQAALGGFVNLLAVDTFGNLAFASGASAVILQDQVPGSSATPAAGSALIINAQQGQNATSGTNAPGGDVLIQSGPHGNGGTAGLAGGVELFAGTTSMVRLTVDGSGNILGNFGSTAPAVALTQAVKPGSSGTPVNGNPFILQAQNGQQGSGVATNSNGGQLQLKGAFAGTGGSGAAGAAGTVAIFNGGTSIATFELSNAGFGVVPYMNVANGGVRGTQVTVVSTSSSTFVLSSTAVFLGTIAAPQAWGFNGNQFFIDAAVSNAQFFQNDNTATGGTASNLTITAQRAMGSGGTCTGGNLTVQAGSSSTSASTAVPGNLFLAGGGIVGAVTGNNGQVAILPGGQTAGSIAFGSPIVVGATTMTVDGTNGGGFTLQVAQHSGTGVETPAGTLSILAQPARAVSGGTNNTGGNILIATGAVGTGGSSGTSGQFQVKDGGAGGTLLITAGAGGKLSFYGAALIAQQTRIANYTDSTGGTPSTTLAAITAGASYAQADMVAAKNAIASLNALINQLKNQLSASNSGIGITT